ncbi:MAG: hypothetical protein GX187_01480 [Clostridiaceae bacterium]|nr:hypothetical protein [Clostridiaceae bacterium]
MQNHVMYELTVFGGAGAAGILIAFLYDLFRLKRRFIRTKTALIHIEDIIYWICAAIILFLSSYILSSGETRGYFFIGTITGALTYAGLFSKPVIWLLTQIIRIVLWPIYKIVMFLRPVFRIMNLKCRRVMGKIKYLGALEGYRFRVNFMRLRNTFTKK